MLEILIMSVAQNVPDEFHYKELNYSICLFTNLVHV